MLEARTYIHVLEIWFDSSDTQIYVTPNYIQEPRMNELDTEFPGKKMERDCHHGWILVWRLDSGFSLRGGPCSFLWAPRHSLLLQALQRLWALLSFWMRNGAWLLRGKPTGGCPVAMTGYGSSWSLSSCFCTQLILVSPKTKATLTEDFSQARGHPILRNAHSTSSFAWCLISTQ